MRKCHLCGKQDNLDRHHIFGAANRKHSEKYGLVVDLCHDECHIFGELAAHRNAQTAQMLHEYGQRKFMREQNADIAGFVKIFGRNFVDESW